MRSSRVFRRCSTRRPHRSTRRAAVPRSTGRRLALAHWLSRPDNPLSTRVIVNRVWQYHFGRGLAGTPSDFGRLGEPPSHPELLDWLATELVREGWQLKPLHRRIVTSASYRQAATAQSTRAGDGGADRSGEQAALEANGHTARRRGDPRRDAGRQRRAHRGHRGPERAHHTAAPHD